MWQGQPPTFRGSRDVFFILQATDVSQSQLYSNLIAVRREIMGKRIVICSVVPYFSSFNWWGCVGALGLGLAA